MMYGASLAIYYRIIKPTHFYSKSSLADWFFLAFIWLAGFTGFWMEAAVTFKADTTMNQVMFIIHTVISMELVLLLILQLKNISVSMVIVSVIIFLVWLIFKTQPLN